jgi:tetratricopeptide (TPR) repeat protein
MRLFMTIALASGLLWNAATAQPAPTDEQRQACQNKSVHVAPDVQIAACSAVIAGGKETPNNQSVSFNNRGQAYAAKQDYEHALQDFDQAIALYPTNATAIYNRAVIWEHQDKLDDAMAGFDKTLELDAKAFPAFIGRGQILLKRKQYQRAVVELDQAVAIAPQNARAYNLRAVGYRELGQYDRAIRDHDQAIKLEPKNALFWNGRCWTRAVAGLLRQALGDCAQALDLKPGDPHVLDSLALVYLKLGQFDQAIEKYNTVLADNPRQATSLFARGVARLRKGDSTGGAADIAGAEAILPEIAGDMARYGVKP